jgi:hypothetical protein
MGTQSWRRQRKAAAMWSAVHCWLLAAQHSQSVASRLRSAALMLHTDSGSQCSRFLMGTTRSVPQCRRRRSSHRKRSCTSPSSTKITMEGLEAVTLVWIAEK